ncbi:MAG: VCBS repeat-containing protein [Verrucomicrobiaceae bacterium]|nr:MAG: VCBS repeat-containing protein [Verrucomicrobiaceae bacterium]
MAGRCSGVLVLVKTPALLSLLILPVSAMPEPPAARFRAQTIDAELKIGYGVAISDVDGDGKADIVLADAGETVWYKNPGWEKHRLTGKLTEQDHVCVAAHDIDSDGKAEIAVGAEWNPGDTLNSGAVFSLHAPEDRTKSWQATKQHREPTVHRMNWVREPGDRHFLAVLPLHGCGNKNGEGDGIRFLGYRPEKEPVEDWQTFLIHQGFHMAHNFQPVIWNAGDTGESLLVAEKEGTHLLSQTDGKWTATRLTTKGSGEVRLGKLPDGGRFIATVEPMHGTDVAIYPERDKAFANRVLADATLNQGHALVTADFLGTGSDQVAAGWREPGKEDKKVGIRLYVPAAADGSAWKLHATIADNTMACEDMKAADFNGDGKPDLVASGRATKNLVIYWNETETR